jgi:hypothetical protein
LVWFAPFFIPIFPIPALFLEKINAYQTTLYSLNLHKIQTKQETRTYNSWAKGSDFTLCVEFLVGGMLVKGKRAVCRQFLIIILIYFIQYLIWQNLIGCPCKTLFKLSVHILRTPHLKQIDSK